MAEEPSPHERRALIEISPEVLVKLRDPRVVLALVCVVAGVVAEIAGYYGVSGTIDPGEQLPYIISGGIGGLFLLGAAAVLFFSLDLHGLKGDVAEAAESSRALADEVRQLRAELAEVSERLAADAATNGTAAPRRRPRTRSGAGSG